MLSSKCMYLYLAMCSIKYLSVALLIIGSWLTRFFTSTICSFTSMSRNNQTNIIHKYGYKMLLNIFVYSRKIGCPEWPFRFGAMRLMELLAPWKKASQCRWCCADQFVLAAICSCWHLSGDFWIKRAYFKTRLGKFNINIWSYLESQLLYDCMVTRRTV